MKTIHRKRITIRETETVVVKTTASQDGLHFCPFCNAPIDPDRSPPVCVKKVPVVNEGTLSENNEK